MRYVWEVGVMTCVIASVGCDRAPTPLGTLSAEDIAALEQIAEEDASIVLARDWDRLASRFAPDAVRMPPNEPALEGRAVIRESLDGMPPLSAFSFRMVDLAGDGQLAYMRGAWTITVTPPDAAPVSDSGKILIVFEKQPDGSWLTVADAWSSDLPLPN